MWRHVHHLPPPPPPPPPPPQHLHPNALLAPHACGVRFNRIGFGTRLRNMYITKVVRAERQEECERACAESRDFTCRSFNFRSFFPAENCELSHYDSKQLKLENPTHFEQQTQFDFYERDVLSGDCSVGGATPGNAVLDVSQSCTSDGMEFTLRTPDGFHGRSSPSLPLS